MKSVFTILIAFFPIIQIYGSPIKGINLAEFIMILFGIFVIMEQQKINIFKDKRCYIMVGFFISCCFITTVNTVFNSASSYIEILIRVIRWGFYIILLTATYYNLDKILLIKLIRKLSLFSCFCLWLQLLFYYLFQIVLTFKLPFLQITTDFGESYVMYNGVFRAYSLFCEPAAFSYFVVIGLAAYLFLNKNIEEKYIFVKALFLSISAIASTSSAGVGMTLIVWLVYFFYGFSETKLNRKKVCFLMVIPFVFLILILYLILTDNEYVSWIFGKFIASSVGDDRSSRIMAHQVYFDKLPTSLQIFGVGIGNEEYYFQNIHFMHFGYSSSIGLIIVGIGMIGLTVMGVFFANMFFSIKKELKVFLILFMALMVFSGALFSYQLVYYLLWCYGFELEVKLMCKENEKKYFVGERIYG